MRFTEADGQKIVSTSTAETVGKVGGFVVDPQSRTVVAVTVKKSAGGDLLRWPDVYAFGHDAVTVTGADKLVNPDPALAALADKSHHMLGKRVLNTAGDEIGKTVDVEFDPSSAQILGLILDTGPIDGARLIGSGSYAVVVHA